MTIDPTLLTHNLGFPRMGANRELKKLVEGYWAGKTDKAAFIQGTKDLRVAHWKVQVDSGISLIPSNDFSLYDQVLDHSFAFNAIPKRYEPVSTAFPDSPLALYFAMAHGLQAQVSGAEKIDVPSYEMKKWFDTNYHFMVPEVRSDQEFSLREPVKAVEEFCEAKETLGLITKPVILGPLSFLSLAKPASGSDSSFVPLSLLDRLLPVYEELFSRLEQEGAKYIQLDEPVLVKDLPSQVSALITTITKRLKAAAPSVKIILATYFDSVEESLASFKEAVFDVLHVDLARGPKQLESVPEFIVANKLPWSLSLGLVDGRNIWRADLKEASDKVNYVVSILGKDRVLIGPSSSLLHVPFALAAERAVGRTISDEILSWMAFAVEKLHEIVAIEKISRNANSAESKELLSINDRLVHQITTSTLIHDQSVKDRINELQPENLKARSTSFTERIVKQHQVLGIPKYLPTTTIGSFPQTKEVRVKRAAFLKGLISQAEYDEFIKRETKLCIEFQERLDLDVLVHGEFERTDMVEFFGEKLKGYVFSRNGWVQSYGSRCVKPPIIYGDVSRPVQMTVDMISYAQSLTTRPVKGMLTGPITCLQWSFVRTDQPRKQTALQLALAIRDEVVDLESAGIRVIQVDEPAIREGLPLKKKDQASYLQWAVESFLLTTNGVRDDTQVHTHMCYSDFNDIFDTIVGMDADVITIENAKSDLKLLNIFKTKNYPNQIGPGLYDIHTPRIPTKNDISSRLSSLLKHLPNELVWVNPDCGLKTRKWSEVEDALKVMINVVKEQRALAGQ